MEVLSYLENILLELLKITDSYETEQKEHR